MSVEGLSNFLWKQVSILGEGPLCRNTSIVQYGDITYLSTTF